MNCVECSIKILKKKTKSGNVQEGAEEKGA